MLGYHFASMTHASPFLCAERYRQSRSASPGFTSCYPRRPPTARGPRERSAAGRRIANAASERARLDRCRPRHVRHWPPQPFPRVALDRPRTSSCLGNPFECTAAGIPELVVAAGCAVWMEPSPVRADETATTRTTSRAPATGMGGASTDAGARAVARRREAGVRSRCRSPLFQSRSGWRVFPPRHRRGAAGAARRTLATKHLMPDVPPVHRARLFPSTAKVV